VVFDLDSGTLLGRFPSPADGKPHLFNDVVVISVPREVLVTDSLAALLSRDRPRTLRRCCRKGTLVYPNGIAILRPTREAVRRFTIWASRWWMRRVNLRELATLP